MSLTAEVGSMNMIKRTMMQQSYIYGPILEIHACTVEVCIMRTDRYLKSIEPTDGINKQSKGLVELQSYIIQIVIIKPVICWGKNG